MLDWFHKTKRNLKKEGGLQEKLESISAKSSTADKILADKRVHNVQVDVDRRRLPSTSPALL